MGYLCSQEQNTGMHLFKQFILYNLVDDGIFLPVSTILLSYYIVLFVICPFMDKNIFNNF